MLKKLKKILPIILALIVVLSFCGCGGSTKEVTGSEQTCGNFTVFVPEGMTVSSGFGGQEDPDIIQLVSDENSLIYIIITLISEESCDSNLESNKSLIENGKYSNCELKYDNGTFTGYTYKGASYDHASFKGIIGDKCVQVSVAGFKKNDAELEAVLKSIAIK